MQDKTIDVFSPLETCIAPSDTMKASHQERMLILDWFSYALQLKHIVSLEIELRLYKALISPSDFSFFRRSIFMHSRLALDF